MNTLAASRHKHVRLNLVITKQLDDMIEKLASANGTNKSEIFRKALVLFKVAHEAKEQGNTLGVVSKDHQVLAEIVGL